MSRHLIFNFPLCKLYTNSLMSSLNSRRGWRFGGTSHHSHTHTHTHPHTHNTHATHDTHDAYNSYTGRQMALDDTTVVASSAGVASDQGENGCMGMAMDGSACTGGMGASTSPGVLPRPPQPIQQHPTHPRRFSDYLAHPRRSITLRMHSHSFAPQGAGRGGELVGGELMHAGMAMAQTTSSLSALSALQAYRPPAAPGSGLGSGFEFDSAASSTLFSLPLPSPASPSSSVGKATGKNAKADLGVEGGVDANVDADAEGRWQKEAPKSKSNANARPMFQEYNDKDGRKHDHRRVQSASGCFQGMGMPCRSKRYTDGGEGASAVQTSTSAGFLSSLSRPVSTV